MNISWDPITALVNNEMMENSTEYNTRFNTVISGISGTSYDDNEYELVKEVQKITDIIILCFSASILFLNGTVIIIYMLFRKGQKMAIPNWMLFNQALVDTLVAGQSIMYTLPTLITLPVDHNCFLAVTTAAELYTCILALGALLLSTTDRFIALNLPLFHKSHVTKCKIVVATVTIWLLSFIPSAFYVIHYNFFNSDAEMLTNFWITGTSLIFAGIASVLFILYFTYATIKKSFLRRTSSVSLRTTQWKNGRNVTIISRQNKKQNRLFKLFFLLTIIYTFSYIPGVIIRVLYHTGVMDHIALYIGLEIAYIIYMSSALFNPILTLSMKDDFKRRLPCVTRKSARKMSETFVSMAKNRV